MFRSGGIASEAPEAQGVNSAPGERGTAPDAAAAAAARSADTHRKKRTDLAHFRLPRSVKQHGGRGGGKMCRTVAPLFSFELLKEAARTRSM